MGSKRITFGPFRLDEPNECLWDGSQAVQLRPKAYAVLKYLLENPGVLVSKQRLLDDVWPNTFVSDAVLKDCVRQLREALGDEARSPRFIETAHRRGYRFIAEVAEEAEHTNLAVSRDSISSPPRFSPLPHPTTQAMAPLNLLGRDDELSQMRGWLERALQAERQVGFITGEAGIGKTTLVDAFLDQAAAPHNVLIARGQCLEQYGSGEAYLPVLDAFSHLARERPQSQIVEILGRHAPSWLLQMPLLTSNTEREALQERALGLTRERMLREMAESIETLTALTPLVLVLEDLHWSDYSTLDLVAYLARRRGPARFLLIGTYRPVEIIVSEHPLRQVKHELQMHKLCQELPLEYLSLAAVDEFLRLKFPQHRFPTALAIMIHQRTEGNPLFMSNVVEHLVDEKIVVERDGRWELQRALEEVELGVPENIRNLIEKHIERLTPEEQRVLEGASVVGMDCSAVAMSAGLAEDVVRIEEICDGLARRNHFLLPAYLAELPDGTITPRYRFIHALYLDVLYERVSPTRRSQIHGRIGERGESVYGERVGEIAAELAVHFEQSRDSVRAVKYLQMAAANAARRSANHEAVSLAQRGLELLGSLPDNTDRASQESNLHRWIDRSKSGAPVMWD